MCKAHYYRKRRGQPMHGSVKPRTEGGAQCAVDDCSNRVSSRGLCSTHSYQRDKDGKVGPRRQVPRGSTLQQRMDYYTAEPNENGCRLWLGGINTSGYPVVSSGKSGGGFMAHRVAYELATGDVPQRHEPIHHTCAVSACVEPSHLQKITSHENTAEMLERTWYIKRIAELEAEVAQLREQLDRQVV
jgi:hypothetical protein